MNGQSDLSFTAGTVTVPDAALRAALQSLGGLPFDKAVFGQALDAAGVTNPSPDLLRRALQHLKRHGLVTYDKTLQHWTVIVSLGAGPVSSPQMTGSPAGVSGASGIPGISGSAVPMGSPVSAGSLPVATLPIEVAEPSHLDRLLDGAQIALVTVACCVIVTALAAINAGFAWRLVDGDMVRVALTAGFLAVDILRPFAMARGMADLDLGYWRRGALAILLALTLAPLSVLSSLTVVSASLSLGVEQNAAVALRLDERAALQARHDQLQVQAEAQWAEWRRECARGGCGPRADALAAKAEQSGRLAEAALEEMRRLSTETAQPTSFPARAARTMAELGLLNSDRTWLMPLALAIALELAALLGPALLLTRRAS